MTQRALPAFAFLALGTLAGPLAADTIVRTDGQQIEDAKVLSASLKEVEYRASGRDKQSLPTDQVLRIEYDKLPKLLDRAEDSLSTGDAEAALIDFAAYVDSIQAKGDKGDSQFPWAPAWALWRQVELRAGRGEYAAVVGAADRLIQSLPESMYVIGAWLSKADALVALEQPDKAVASLRELVSFAESKGLSDRFRLEAELALAEIDPALDAAKRRAALADIAKRAGDGFPVVRSRAEVAQAELLVADQEYSAAEDTLQRVVDSGAADDRTLAAAWTSLGDCRFQAATKLFKEGATERAQQAIQSALLAYMRVVVSFGGQPRYVARSMFFAARSFDQLQDEESKARAQRLYRSVEQQFPGSSWAKEARDFRR